MKSEENQNQTVKKTSVSFPAELYEAAMAKANKQRRSFSNYLQTLAEADVAKQESGDK